MATLSPALRMSAALRSSSWGGMTRGWVQPTPENTAPCSRGGDWTASDSPTSSGMITAATVRLVSATLHARSIRWRAWPGTMQVWMKSEATSLYSEFGSISCWKADPSPMRFCCPMIATTGWWSSLAS